MKLELHTLVYGCTGVCLTFHGYTLHGYNLYTVDLDWENIPMSQYKANTTI